MAIMDLEYIEINGLLYPNIEIGGSEVLKNLGKYGRLRLEYFMGSSSKYIGSYCSLASWQITVPQWIYMHSSVRSTSVPIT